RAKKIAAGTRKAYRVFRTRAGRAEVRPRRRGGAGTGVIVMSVHASHVLLSTSAPPPPSADEALELADDLRRGRLGGGLPGERRAPGLAHGRLDVGDGLRRDDLGRVVRAHVGERLGEGLEQRVARHALLLGGVGAGGDGADVLLRDELTVVVEVGRLE